MKTRDKYLKIEEASGEDLIIRGTKATQFEGALVALCSQDKGAAMHKDLALTKLKDKIQREQILVVPKSIVPKLIKAIEEAIELFDPRQFGFHTPKQHEQYKKNRIQWARMMLNVLKNQS